MRRLLSLALAAGLTAPFAAVADGTSPSKSNPSIATAKTEPSTQATTDTTPTATHGPAMPSFMQKMLIDAGVLPKPEPVHPFLAWLKKTFEVDPQPMTTPTPHAPVSSSKTATASR